MQTHAFEAAIEAYATALTYNPDNPWEHTLRYQIAVANFDLGNVAEARKILNNLITDEDIQPTDLKNASTLLDQIDTVAPS